MAQHIFSFLTSSLFMGLLILVILTLQALLPRTFSPKLRYAAWIVILIGLIIPFRPMIGNGLIILDVQYVSIVESGVQTNEARNMASAPPTISELEQSITTYEPVTQSMRQALSITYVLVITWGGVALAIFIYHILRYIGYNKLIRRWGIVIKDEKTLSILQSIQIEKKISNKNITLKKCDFISTSMIIGFIKPIILLPDKMFGTDELELIFRHELIHYKRGDLLIKLMSLVAVSLNWFNPAVYMMSVAMQNDCEASCDEAVIADVGGSSKQFYAEIIIDMIGSKRTGGTALSTCFYGSKKGIKKRMEAIMSSTGNVNRIAFSALAILVMVIIMTGSIIVFGNPSSQQESLVPTTQQPTNNYEQQNHNAGQVTSQIAREIAVQFVGHGTVSDVRAFTEDSVLVFEVEVRYSSTRYVVLINAENGDVTRLTRYIDDHVTSMYDEQPTAGPSLQPTPVLTPSPHPSSEPSPSPTTTPSHDNDRSHNHGQSGVSQSNERGGRPSNPEITLERAIEIAYADLETRGINATFRRDSGMDWEREQWVWELEFRTNGERMPIIEFYINVDTGYIVKFEWDD